jgi:hypothetical protein
MKNHLARLRVDLAIVSQVFAVFARPWNLLRAHEVFADDWTFFLNQGLVTEQLVPRIQALLTAGTVLLHGLSEVRFRSHRRVVFAVLTALFDLL